MHADGMTVLWEDSRIQAVFPGGEQPLPPGTEVHDLEGRYVIPGLINSHVHLMRRFLESREAMYDELERMLLGGVVAIRDMAGDARVMAAARRDILAGERLGPDVYNSAVFGGPEFAARDPRMARSSIGYRPGESPWAQAVTDESDLPRAIARADGAQVSALKLYLGFEPELIGRLADEAHRQGLQVWAHATVFPSRPLDVVRAGVDVISHACGIAWQDADLDPSPYAGANVRQRPSFDPSLVEAESPEMAKLFEEMVRRGAVFDPTLSNHARPGDDRFGCTTNTMVGLTQAAHRSGVALSTGTDWFLPLEDVAPTVLHEIEALVDHEVLTPEEALTAATLHGARALGREQDYGTVEPGKLASLVVLEEDPAQDVRALRNVVAVVQRGKLHWREGSEAAGDSTSP
jgi:imidazolonepropionase-like amidohydrolase